MNWPFSRLCASLTAWSLVIGHWSFAAPPASQPDRGATLGRLEGRISPARAVESVNCLDRGYNMSYVVRWKPADGGFSVNNLAPGRRYDLEVKVADGRKFIGVDLAYEEDPLLRLARQQIGQDEPPGPLTDDDRKQIDDIVVKVETFEDQRRIVALRGGHERAAALVELRRTRPFHSGKPGENIRRVEIWYFKFQHGGWEKIANAEKVLLRDRGQAADVDARAEREVYMPELGGLLVDAAGRSASIDVTLSGFPAPPATSQPAAR